MPTSVRPRRSISGKAAARSARAAASTGSVLCRRPRQRVRAGRSCVVTEAESQDDGTADASGCPQPPCDPVDERDDVARRRTRATRASALGRAAEPIDPRRRRRCTGRGSRLWASACRCRPGRRPEHRHEGRLGQERQPADGRDASVTEPAGGDGATPQSRSTGSGWRNASLTVGRHHEEAVRLGDRARYLGEELGPRHSDRDRQADLVTDVPSQPRGDLGRRADASLHPADVEERLVDRDPLDDRRNVVEDPEDRLARIDIGGHPGRDDRRAGAQAAGSRRAHRRAHSEGLRLVARCEHHPQPDDHGPAPQARVVPLLDRRKERVQVGVQDRCIAPRHERMFSRLSHRAARDGVRLQPDATLRRRDDPRGCGARSAPRSPRRPPATSARGTSHRPSRAARAAPP